MLSTTNSACRDLESWNLTDTDALPGTVKGPARIDDGHGYIHTGDGAPNKLRFGRFRCVFYSFLQHLLVGLLGYLGNITADECCKGALRSALQGCTGALHEHLA